MKKSKSQIGRASRAKGARAEREIANIFKRYGFDKARRGVQFQGSPDSPDVKTGIPWLHVEVKRVEALSIYSAMDQAENDADIDMIPTVFHKRNNKKWLTILRTEDFMALLRRLEEKGS